MSRATPGLTTFFSILAYYVLVALIAIAFPQLTKCQSHETYETSGSSSFQSSNGISEDCAPAAMARCTDPLKVVTDNRDLGFATSMDELQEMCPYDIYIREYILNIFKHIIKRLKNVDNNLFQFSILSEN